MVGHLIHSTACSVLICFSSQSCTQLRCHSSSIYWNISCMFCVREICTEKLCTFCKCKRCLNTSLSTCFHSFSALTLLVGQQDGHLVLQSGKAYCSSLRGLSFGNQAKLRVPVVVVVATVTAAVIELVVVVVFCNRDNAGSFFKLGFSYMCRNIIHCIMCTVVLYFILFALFVLRAILGRIHSVVRFTFLFFMHTFIYSSLFTVKYKGKYTNNLTKQS